MNPLNELLEGQHRQADVALAEAEVQVAAGDWPAARAAGSALDDELRAHFRREETVLFPAFEAATGSDCGPTRVMRDEHEQICTLLDALRRAGERCDADAWLGLSDTLVLLMQQHNMKEEQILFPMAARLLAARLPALLDGLRPAALSV